MATAYKFKNVSPLTDGAIAEARSMIGEDLQIEQYNHEATYDTIRHYAHGIGDANPLWCDEDYAAGAQYRTIVAPPTFLYSVFAPGIAPAFPGMQSFQAGGDCTWHRLPRRGDRIHAVARLTDVQEVKGRTVERLIIEHGETEYRDQNDELLALCKSRSFRAPRPGADGALQYEHKDQHEYSEDDLARIEADVFAEECRGATPRYWEDVNVGDQLQPVVKGPLDRLTMTCYYAGALATAAYKGSEIKWRMYRLAHTHPELLPNNYDITYFQEFGNASAGHQDDGVAQALGMPAAYDNGHQRMGWVAHLLTNWIGDDGFLRHMYTEIRRPNIFGNTVWISGTVTGKARDENGDGLAEIAISAVDQVGVQNTRGHATVVLPVRER